MSRTSFTVVLPSLHVQVIHRSERLSEICESQQQMRPKKKGFQSPSELAPHSKAFCPLHCMALQLSLRFTGHDSQRPHQDGPPSQRPSQATQHGNRRHFLLVRLTSTLVVYQQNQKWRFPIYDGTPLSFTSSNGKIEFPHATLILCFVKPLISCSFGTSNTFCAGLPAATILFTIFLLKSTSS